MTNALAEWIDKAEGDYVSAWREYRARNRPNFDAACFPAQQCIEKYLKARIIKAGAKFSKTHDLSVLLDACLPHEPLWEAYRDDLKMLSRLAVLIRYPGETADRARAKTALAAASKLRDTVRLSLGLPVKKPKSRKRK